jgi:hypothetical protein
MNIQKLNAAVEALKSDLGVALVATDIFGFDGLTLAGFNSQPAAAALFTQVTMQLQETLLKSGFPPLNRYYFLDMAGNNGIIVINLGDYLWGILVDMSKLNLGILFNIALPNAIKNGKEALE